MTYSIAFSEEADSDFGHLLRSDRRLAARILAKVESLADSPREGGLSWAITKESFL